MGENQRIYSFYRPVMSLGYPTIRPSEEGALGVALKEEIYGTPNVMLQGLHKVKDDLASSHPLEHSERQWHENQAKMDFAMLRSMQGAHAPMKIQMERHTAAKMQRLPCLNSSSLMLDSLTGKLDTIDYEDTLNNPADSEVMGQPHLMTERQLKLI